MLRKVALITGATGEIGSAIAYSLSNKGYNLILCGNKNNFPNKKFKTDYEEYKFDVSNNLEVKKFFDIIKSKYKKIDLVVCCAGKSYNEMLLTDQTDQQIDDLIKVNLCGTIYVNKYCLSVLNKGASIINIASFLGVQGCSCEAVYSASKAGIIGLTKSLAKEYSSFGIRVNSISPGFIETKMNSEFSLDEKIELTKKSLINRLGKPDDVAKSVLFLVENDFITGENIIVSGGLSV